MTNWFLTPAKHDELHAATDHLKLQIMSKLNMDVRYEILNFRDHAEVRFTCDCSRIFMYAAPKQFFIEDSKLVSEHYKDENFIGLMISKAKNCAIEQFRYHLIEDDQKTQ